MKRLFVLLVAALMAGCISPPQKTSTESAPTWQFTGSHSYEQEHPGLGISHRYTSSAGWTDVYTYTLGRNNWISGISDPQFAAHFNSTIDEVRVHEQRGFYSSVWIGTINDTVVAGQAFRTVTFRYTNNGKPMHSMTYLTARNGQLLKYRVSIYAASGLDVTSVAREFVEEHAHRNPGISGMKEK